MSQERLPQVWSEIFQSIKPFGETDLAEVLLALGSLMGLDASLVSRGDTVLARVGGVRDFAGATPIDLEHSEATLLVLRSSPLTDDERYDLHVFSRMLDLAMLASDRRDAQASTPMIEPMGTKDRLTDTIDRDSFSDYLNIEFAAGPSAASVIVVGLDGLGIVNDTLGHTAGDVVLAETANRLRATLRSCDVVSRLGGDVFGIYCPSMGLEIATKLAGRLQVAIGEPVSLGSKEVRVTATAGLASRSKGEDAAETLSHADLALQAGKDLGAGELAIYDGELRVRIEDRRALATEFVTALEENQLSTAVDPIVQLPGGTVVGVEARVIWNHPERGSIDRTEFIDLAELIGRVSDVERAVLEYALLQPEADGDSTRTGVTISGSTLRDPLAVSWIIERLQSSPQQVIIEVTENAINAGGSLVERHLSQLREAGASIVLDDFGVSEASLRVLHAFDFDGVKLHHSLIAEGDTRRAAAIFEAVYASGAVVGFDVVHTGIETDRELGLLMKMAQNMPTNSVFAQGAAVRARVTPAKVAA